MENQSVTIENRERIRVIGVKSLEAFDEEAILANLQEGGIIIRGENLTVEALDVESECLIATGKIESLNYSKIREKRNFSFPFRK